MFGFGDSKKKKYKKALEEFLQKMMSVKDYFEIIQARGKGQSQMAEMLGVKVSDTDYWAKEHFEEYKTKFSESDDPLADIELRLKNYSFIKKEMENFINYAKELEMNLTQGFVDDYYATVSTILSLENVKKEFSDTKFNIVGTFYSDGKNIDKEFIKVELFGNNTGLVKQKIFQFNNLVEVDSNCINENFETVEKFYDEEKEKQNFLIYTELNHLSYFEYFCSSITLIKRLDNYPKDFTKINIKVRGLGFYSTNREVQIEVDKIEFLKLTSTYWLTFFSDHTSENIVGSSHRSADESFGMIKKLNKYYPNVYFAECWEENIEFKGHKELYAVKKYFVDDKLNLSYINIYGPDGFFQSKYFLGKPEELKNPTNEISEEKYDDLEDDSELGYNYMTFFGIDYYLIEEFEKLSDNENFYQVINGGMFNKLEKEKSENNLPSYEEGKTIFLHQTDTKGTLFNIFEEGYQIPFFDGAPNETEQSAQRHILYQIELPDDFDEEEDDPLNELNMDCIIDVRYIEGYLEVTDPEKCFILGIDEDDHRNIVADHAYSFNGYAEDDSGVSEAKDLDEACSIFSKYIEKYAKGKKDKFIVSN